MAEIPQQTAKPRPGYAFGLPLLALLAAKFKLVLGLLKALPFAKLLITGGSMLAMVFFEARRAGWWFAVGFVFLILIHELGHGFAMKQRGVSAGWPIFIPFFGAMIAMKDQPRDADTEAAIAYGGPLAGTGVSLVVAALGLNSHSPGMLALAYTGFFLNLFNLIPLSPLDGGRIAQAFSKNVWKLGLLILGGMFWLTKSPQLLLIGAMALPRLFRGSDAAGHSPLEPALQRVWAARYFGLVAFLAAAAYFCQRLMAPPSVDY